MKLNLMKLCTGTIVSAALVYGADKALAASPDAMYSTFETYDGNDLELVVDSKGTHFTLWSPGHRKHMCYSIPPTVTRQQPPPSQ